MIEYWVVLNAGRADLERKALLCRAWGRLPVSYVQDHEDLASCTYLDVKVNKWEIDSLWSKLQPQEPWIRLEFFRGELLDPLLGKYGLSLASRKSCNTIVVIRVDEGGSDIDRKLALALASALTSGESIYQVDNEGLLQRSITSEDVPTGSEFMRLLSAVAAG
jgi:hypothetical protein